MVFSFLLNECVEKKKLARYDGVYYQYDAFGNLMTRTLADNTQQRFIYNLKDQLVEAMIEHPDDSRETWHYQYDVLGRRIAKYREGDKKRYEFVWDGSHLVQEKTPTGDYTYIYSHPDSYEPLAQIKKDKAGKQSIAYFHTDQIGIPREMTAENGNLLWHGEYLAWGGLYNENNLANAHQPFRLQNQYCDKETGLHYNFFRYYDPNCGRFIGQDPIGLQGGENFYAFAGNATGFVDPLGLAKICTRPLEPLMGLPLIGDFRTNGWTNIDLGIYHEHIFFEDGTNIGYAGSGTFSETDPMIIAKYKCGDKNYDDKTMHQAVNNTLNIPDNKLLNFLKLDESKQYGSDNYGGVINNCQDFISDVKGEYKKLQ